MRKIKFLAVLLSVLILSLPVEVKGGIQDMNLFPKPPSILQTINELDSWPNFVRKEFEQRAVNVKWFGAKGDGVTDDTAAIQAAIDTAYSSGKGIVFIPPGEYIVSSTINTKGVSILGAGMYTTILHYTGTGYCLQSPTPTPVWGYGTISNLKVKGNNQGKGILLNDTHEGFIEHIFFADLDVGLELSNSYTNRIDKCRFYNTDIGILLGTGSNAIALTNLEMGSCNDCCILIKGGSGIWISNSQFEESGAGVKCVDSADLHPWVHGLVLNMCYGESLTNGLLYVSFTQTSTGSRIYGLTVENCYVHQADTASYGIDIEDVSPSAIRGSLNNVFIFDAVTAGVRITRGHVALNNVWHWNYSNWAEKTLLSSDSTQVTVLKSNTDIIRIEKGFFKHNVPGSGYRVITPDGTKTYEIYVDDTGAVVTKLV